MQKLTTKHCNQYLKEGPLTKYFLDRDLVIDKIAKDYNSKIQTNSNYTHIESLMNLLKKYFKFTKDEEFKKCYKFRRTAKEIYDSRVFTGCTDCALLFATLARQINIPTTILHTAELNWFKSFKSGKFQQSNRGHSFCECYYNGQWILVDPTCSQIIYDYNVDKIILHYNVGTSNIFVPYFRGLDIGKKQTIGQHNEFMIKECERLEIESLLD